MFESLHNDHDRLISPNLWNVSGLAHKSNDRHVITGYDYSSLHMLSYSHIHIITVARHG